MVHGLLRRLDDVIHALIQHVQVKIGGDHGHLDEFVATEDVKSGHLAIDPHQHVFHVTTD